MILKLSFSLIVIFRSFAVLDNLDTTNDECYKLQIRYGNVIENVLPRNYIWTNATVAYTFQGAFEQREQTNIYLAMRALMEISCLKFQERTSEARYVVITNTLGSGCWADTGRQERGQTYVNLASDCTLRLGTILHELMHVLGFLHQHTRPDRDLYLCVRYENIVPQPAALYNYEKVHPWTNSAFPLPYDFESITHYTVDMYSVDPGRLPTMSLRYPFKGITIGQRKHLTDYDVLAIHFLYCV